MAKRLAIIDYGLGNLHSVRNSMQLAAPDWEITLCNQPKQLAHAEKFIFPGVGAIGDCLDGLARLDLIDPLLEAIQRRWCLAICVGFQALFGRMYEFAERDGLGVLPGEIRHIQDLIHQMDTPAAQLRIPHSGWNRLQIQPDHRDHPLFCGLPADPWVYFVHSYALAARGQRFVAATTSHGAELATLIIHNRLVGCQFHPEKSHANGQRLLTNFMQL